MGKRQDNLIALLKTHTNKVDCEFIPKPQFQHYKDSKYYQELIRIYRSLGGKQNEIPFNIGKYDCIVNGMIVELDEENHFNRYRAITLKAGIYQNGKTLNLERYLDYCKTYEDKCNTHGGYWSNNSTEKLFGKSNNNGNLNGEGSSRWKQRAFYDLLKDHIPLILDIPVKRISIYDTIILGSTRYKINDILKGSDKRFAESIYKTIFS